MDPKGLPSYPKIYNLGHKYLKDLFEGEVVVQEKIDGSQFSFGITEEGLTFRSKGARIWPETTDNLFKGAVETVTNIQGRLKEGVTYRGEVLHRPKHNTVVYDRVPIGNIILFDIDIGLEDRLSPEEVREEVGRLGLEVVPTYPFESIPSYEELERIVSTMKPYLGGEAIEGVVIKNYNRFNPLDGKMLMGKLVAQDFRERNQHNWKEQNPGKGDVIQMLIGELRTEARWQKAIQHRRESGLLEEAPQDIGPLIRDIRKDVEEEEVEYIKEKLFASFKHEIMRGVSGGFPEWYKNQLLRSQFDGDSRDSNL